MWGSESSPNFPTRGEKMFDPSLRAPCMTANNMLSVAEELLKGLQRNGNEVGWLDPHGNVEGPFGTAQVDILVEALTLWRCVFMFEHPTAKAENPY
jgi:hypothetical protein